MSIKLIATKRKPLLFLITSCNIPFVKLRRMGRQFVTAIVCLLLILPANAQNADSSQPVEMSQTIRKIMQDNVKRKMEQFKRDEASAGQLKTFDQIKKKAQDINTYLKSSLDTFRIRLEYNQIIIWNKEAENGIFNNHGGPQTSRNLATSYILMSELLHRTQLRQEQIVKALKDVRQMQFQLDSLISDSIFLNQPSDSAAIMTSFLQYSGSVNESFPTDSTLKVYSKRLVELEMQGYVLQNLLNGNLAQIESFRRNLSGTSLKKESAYIWEPQRHKRDASNILDFSLSKGLLAFSFYIGNHSVLIGISILLLIGIYILLRNLRKQMRQFDDFHSDPHKQLVLRRPFSSAMLITSCIAVFFFIEPPFVFYSLFFLNAAIALTRIFYGYISRYWMRMWLILLVMLFVSWADNNMLHGSRTERWWLLIFSVAGIIALLPFLIGKDKHESLKEKKVINFVWAIVILQSLSLIANLFGRYNFAKSLFAGAYFGLTMGIILLWAVRLLNQLLALESERYKTSSGKGFYIDFKTAHDNVPKGFYIVMYIGWFTLFVRNFYGIQLVINPIVDFLQQERTVGSYTFSFQNLLIFLFILFISGLVSRLVSFFASEAAEMSADRKKSGWSSWVLLIRIAVICGGVFLAFAAAGFPLDKITIVFGALSVGIGFGLQTLVNNLVSGLIISFERPINVGDIVEIGNQSGTMKSIGFRSSVITTFDGADVIIPNGDLLNQHLINWTLSDRKRRAELIVGVAYGTDLQQAKEILQAAMDKDERILFDPPTNILVREFNSSSIDFRMLFWVDQTNSWTAVKSDLISTIDFEFKKVGIEIPFPQQDLHIRSFVSQGQEKDSAEVPVEERKPLEQTPDDRVMPDEGINNLEENKP